MHSLQDETPARNMEGDAEARAVRAAEAVARIIGRPDSAPARSGQGSAPSGPDRGLEAARQRLRRAFEARGPRKPEPERLPLDEPKQPIVKRQPARPVVAAGKPEPVIRLAAAAIAAGDVRLWMATRVLLVALSWRYRPGRPWRGNIVELARILGIPRRTAYAAVKQAIECGHLVRLAGALWWPVIESAAGTGWQPPEQLELPLIETGDQAALDYLTSRR